MGVIKASLIGWTNKSSSGQPNGKYYKNDLLQVKAAAGDKFSCFAYYKGDVPSKYESGNFKDEIIFVIALDSNNYPIVDTGYYAAIPCPPYCEGDIGPDLEKGDCTTTIPTKEP